MSFSVSGISSSSPVFAAEPPASSAPPVPTPTLAQQLEHLASTGLSNEQIATAVGLSVTQVLSSLDETSVTTQAASSTGIGLSIKV